MRMEFNSIKSMTSLGLFIYYKMFIAQIKLRYEERILNLNFFFFESQLFGQEGVRSIQISKHITR